MSIELLPAVPIRGSVYLPHDDFKVEIGRPFSKAAILQSEANYEREVLLLFQSKDSNPTELPTLETCSEIGLISHFENKVKLPNGNYKVRFIPFARIKVNKLFVDIDSLKAEYSIIDEIYGDPDEEKSLMNRIKKYILEQGSEIVVNQKLVYDVISGIENGSELSDTLVTFLKMTNDEKLELLKDPDVNSRLIKIITKIESVFYDKQIDEKIDRRVREQMEKSQKEYHLREKMRAIQEELGDVGNTQADIDNLRKKINEAQMPEKIHKKVLKELQRYQSTSSGSIDSSMIRTYLDTVVDLPWYKQTVDENDVAKAKEKLDETHFGLDKVKDRILEYLSVKLYTNKNPQTILCLAGPPGVGKTTLAISIAKALGRKFVKQSLGGISDEAEIRGHRRTYVGAIPGRIIAGMIKAGVTNPVFLLDEIDKIGSNRIKGDPSDALLEVLDPEQNKYFSDNFIEDPYDLANVMFITTANDVSNIPRPLYDRMEIIELSSYTEMEKFQIARKHLIKQELEVNGLEEEKYEITDGALKKIIKEYTLEAGVRDLRREISTTIRKAIRKILEEKIDKVVINEENVVQFLGREQFLEADLAEKEDLVGVVNGLAWTAYGGATLQIEATTYKGKGNLKLTGNLGDVMKESAQAAYSYVRSHAKELNIDESVFDEVDIHIHVPEGATPKDGPSAGVTITTAIASVLTHKKVKRDIGMTGEVTLRGRVLMIGGLKEKSIAACKFGLKEVLIPKQNEVDLNDIPNEVKEAVRFIPVSTLDEVLKEALID